MPAQYGLQRTLRSLHDLFDQETRSASLPDAFVTPGFWAPFVVRARALRLCAADLSFPNENLSGYARALGLAPILGDDDDYEFKRHNAGKSYSPLVRLASQNATDDATAQINGCIQNLTQHAKNSDAFVHSLYQTVGDLHENVWAHGMSEGVSMAQRWKVPYQDDYNLEFALADGGLGFLREVQRIGLDIETDEDAIRWCITEGNSTKGATEPKDDWAQQLPEDAIGNPFPECVARAPGPNHHQGIGLAKLINLVTSFGGFAYVASGSSVLKVTTTGYFRYHVLPDTWQGVAISCRFRESQFSSVPESQPKDEGRNRIAELVERLKGER